MPAERRPWLSVTALTAVAASFGSGHVAARYAFANGVNIITAATVRSLFASLLLVALLRWRKTPVLPLTLELKWTVALGLLLAVQTVLIQAAVSLMPVAVALLVFYSYPFFTAVTAAVLGDVRFSARLLVPLAAAFLGIGLVLRIGSQPIDVTGVLASLGASISFTAALLLTPRLAPTLAAPVRTFFMLATTAVVFVIASLASQGFALPRTGAGYLGLAGLSVFYGFAISGLFLLLSRVGPVQAAIVLNLEPVMAALIAWTVLGEALSVTQTLGMLVVVVAVIGFQLTGRR